MTFKADLHFLYVKGFLVWIKYTHQQRNLRFAAETIGKNNILFMQAEFFRNWHLQAKVWKRERQCEQMAYEHKIKIHGYQKHFCHWFKFLVQRRKLRRALIALSGKNTNV